MTNNWLINKQKHKARSQNTGEILYFNLSICVTAIQYSFYYIKGVIVKDTHGQKKRAHERKSLKNENVRKDRNLNSILRVAQEVVL